MISSSIRTVIGVGAVFVTVLTAQTFVPHAAQSPVTTAPQGGPVPVAPPAGRGGGRGNPTAALFTQLCSGCHGEARLAPTLSNPVFLASASDEFLAATIRQVGPQFCILSSDLGRKGNPLRRGRRSGRSAQPGQ